MGSNHTMPAFSGAALLPESTTKRHKKVDSLEYNLIGLKDPVEGKKEFSGQKLVDVTDQVRYVVNEMFTDRGHAVLRIWRSENELLWQSYSQRKQSLPVAKDALTVGTEEFSRVNGVQLDLNRNEKLLWHGTLNESFAKSICKDGFDLKLARSGTFGFGAYFSGDLTTPLSRAGTHDGTTKFLILSRVILGRPYRASTRLQGYKRSPPGEDQPTDSVVGLVSYGSQERVEYVVYASSQIYPEYIVKCISVP